jgi:uncharacterized membrane protein
MTFPVLFLMLSTHFPGVYGARHHMIALGLLMIAGVATRHLMIGGRRKAWAAVPLTASLIALVAGFPPGRMSAPAVGAAPDTSASDRPATFASVQAIVTSRCVACHSATPRIDTFGSAPGGVSFDDPREVLRWARRVELRVVHTRTMPLGNMTGMTGEERDLIARWVARGAPTD